MILRSLAALAASAALSAAPAHAASADCALLDAIAQPGSAALRGIASAADQRGQIAMSYRGEPTSLDGASGCEISGPPDLFQIDCNWAMAGDLAAAQREHARIKAALEPCLSGAFVLQDYETTVEGLEVLQFFKGKFAGDADQAGEVSLEIQHYATIDGSYSVILSISR